MGWKGISRTVKNGLKGAQLEKEDCFSIYHHSLFLQDHFLE